MKKAKLFFLLLFLYYPLFSQKQANTWYFGVHAGLDFSSQEPRPLTNGSMEAAEGCAVMSDANGRLLFYSNGEAVWNRNHSLMPNGSALAGENEATQAALIVPVPAAEHQFYLFTVSSGQRTSTDKDTLLPAISYSVVDMALESGLGNILPSKKNILLAENMTEKLTAIPHANGKDFWLLSHKLNSNEFWIHLITESGISAPNIQLIGSKHTVKLGSGYDNYNESRGYLKASPNGTMVASAAFSTTGRPFELFDFDAATGLLSNGRQLGNLILQYGVSFSPDNSKLYVSGTDSLQFSKDQQGIGRGPIFQYDLQAGNLEDIIASRVDLFMESGSESLRKSITWSPAIQIAPNGKIYIAGNVSAEDVGDLDEDHTLFIIEQPNRKGVAAGLRRSIFDFGESRTWLGLPNFMQYYFNHFTTEDNPNIPCNSDIALKVYPNPTADLLTIQLPKHCDDAVIQCSIYTLLGQKINSFRYKNNAATPLDISNYPVGTYILIFNTTPLAEEKGAREIVKRIIKI